MVQEQLRDLETFTGEPGKISWETFQYKFENALSVATEPELLLTNLKLALLRQKLGGAPAELIRLEPELRSQSYKELKGMADVQIPRNQRSKRSTRESGKLEILLIHTWSGSRKMQN